MNRLESVPTVWDDRQDTEFFRIVAHVLPCRWVEAASLLLLTNDFESEKTEA